MGIHSRTINEIKVYDLTDWRDADRLGKIRIWEQYPDRFPLSGEDREYYEKMQTAYTLTQNEISVDRCVKKLQRNGLCETKRKAEMLYSDMCTFTLMTEATTANKQWKRRMYLERLELVADFLFKEGTEKGKPELVAQAADVVEKAAKLAGLYDMEEMGKIKAGEWKPKQIVAIKKQNVETIEAAEIEEVENE